MEAVNVNIIIFYSRLTTSLYKEPQLMVIQSVSRCVRSVSQN